MAEGQVEDDGEDEADNSGATEVPREVGVGNNRGAGEADDVGDTGVEEVDGGNQTSHVDGGAGVGDTVRGHVDKELGDTTNGEGDSQPPDADVGNAFADLAVGGTHVTAGRQLVGVVVEDGVADATDRRQEETGRDTGDGAVVDTHLTQEGVQAVVEKRGADNDAQAVEVAENIVGDTVRLQHGRQEVGGGADAVVVEVLDGEEAEDTGCLECLLHVLDKLIVPVAGNGLTAGSHDRGLRGVPPALAADLHDSALLQTHTNNAETVGKVAAARRVQNKALEQVPQEERKGQVQDEGHEESQPPSDVLLDVRSGDVHEATDVDQQVEPEHDSLSGGLGILNDLLALLGLDNAGYGSGHLVQKDRGHVGLEHGGANGQDVERDEVGDLGGAIGQEILGAGSDHENVSDTADSHTVADHLEPTGLSIGQVTEQEGQDIGQQTERLANGVGDLGTQAKGTTGFLSTGRGRAITVTTNGQWPVDVVVDQGLDTIVRGSFGELDGADHVGDHGNTAGDSAQGREFLFCRLAIVVVRQLGVVLVRRRGVAGGSKAALDVFGAARGLALNVHFSYRALVSKGFFGGAKSGFC